MSASNRPTLGSSMRALRIRHGLTLKEMSSRTGIPFSTLAKVEHDRLTLTYDKLQTISERLNIPMADMFAEPGNEARAAPNGRRSVATLSNALQIVTPNYDYNYFAPELRDKDMIPIFAHLKAKSLAEFGPLLRHGGQEFFFVIEGSVVVHTEFYDPTVLKAGEAIYIDSRMGHGYVLAEGCEHAVALVVCSTSQEELLDSATSQVPQVPVSRAPASPAATRRRRPSRSTA